MIDLGCFHFCAIMNHGAMDIHVQIFVWKYVSILGGVHITGSGNAGLCGNSMSIIM